MTLSKIAKTLGLGAAIVGLSAGAALAATATTDVNVRTGPGTQYRAIDTLDAGQRVAVTNEDGGWCQIRQNGPEGWVSCRYLTADNSYRGYDDSYADDYGPDVSIQFGFGNAYPNWPYQHPHHRNWPDSYPHPHSSGFGFSFGN